MPNSVYDVIELVGTSTKSWEKAAKAAVDMAAKSLRDLRIAEVVEQDMQLKIAAISTAALAAFSHDSVLVPTNSMTSVNENLA